MKIEGRRRSTNVEDRRGISGKAVGVGGGLIGVIVAVVMALMGGGDPSEAIGSAVQQLQAGGNTSTEYVEDATDAHLKQLADVVLAGTEDAWTEIFREQGWGEYRPPKLVIYHGTTNSACGTANNQIGPFYCSGDQTVYLDLEFFRDMKKTIGGDGDFAYAYVIAHEVGHHVQYLRGTLDKAHSQMARLSEKEANKISVRLELQADFYAGVWANRDNRNFGSIEPGDIESAVDVAGKIGDDYLQKKAYGREMPDKFNHGRASQRMKWLKRGIDTGDVRYGDTFSPNYSDL